MNNVIVPELTTNSYVIQAEAVAETRYAIPEYASSQMMIHELVEYFREATKALRHKRQELFQE